MESWSACVHASRDNVSLKSKAAERIPGVRVVILVRASIYRGICRVCVIGVRLGFKFGFGLGLGLVWVWAWVWVWVWVWVGLGLGLGTTSFLSGVNIQLELCLNGGLTCVYEDQAQVGPSSRILWSQPQSFTIECLTASVALEKKIGNLSVH